MFLKKGQLPILIFTLIYLVASTFIFIGRQNYEFIMYIGVIALFFVLILLTNKKVNYPNFVLWGLSIWGLLHMLGGGYLLSDGRVLYKWMIITFSETYSIFRYDQFVHLTGFFVATILMFVLLKPLLRQDLNSWWSLSIIVVMAGLGVGALNEIVEFTATVLIPETGVGGFINMSLDLVADLVGAILAMIYIRIRKGNI